MLRADLGRGRGADRKVGLGWDPSDPTIDGCPKASVCCKSLSVDSVEFKGWPKAGVVVEVRILPKTEVTVS